MNVDDGRNAANGPTGPGATADRQATDWFRDVDTIVATPLIFKARLAIGEDAYAALKIRNAVVQAWDVAGVATTAAVVAKSSVVASTFFAPSGWLAAIGIGTAVTPVGWVIAAGVVTGGAWYGITRHLKKATAKRVTVVPNFINTPLDVLALGLFDLLAPLALKVAAADGDVGAAERRGIHDYFVTEWGYDPAFVAAGTRYIESILGELSVTELARTLAEFANENPDCNFRLMAEEILGFLRGMVRSGGRVGAPEERSIAEIEAVFRAANRYSLKKQLRAGWNRVRQRAARLLRRRN